MSLSRPVGCEKVSVTTGLPEEGVEIIASSPGSASMALDSSIPFSNGLVAWIPYAVMLDTVLEARELPGVISNLDASVADVDASSSTGFVAWLVPVWLVTVLEA